MMGEYVTALRAGRVGKHVAVRRHEG
jgi:hypothetical protein